MKEISATRILFCGDQLRVAMLMALLFATSPRPAAADETYTAGSATLSNGAVAQTCDSCPGGSKVGYIGGDSNGTVTFPHIQVPQAGLYAATLLYSTADDRSFVISVNDEQVPRTVICKRTAGRDETSSKTILLPLRAGTNTIAFSNPHEFGPDLASITIGGSPVESYTISGVIRDTSGAPQPGTAVDLSGEEARQTATDASGQYEFALLPKGEYHVTPIQADRVCAPADHYLPDLAADSPAQDFNVAPLGGQREHLEIMRLGQWRVEYGLDTGAANLFCRGALVISNAYAAARAPERLTSMGYREHRVSSHRVADPLGRGVEYEVESSNEGADRMIQTFRGCADGILVDVKIIRGARVLSNYIAPLVTDSPVAFLPQGDNRALFVPFDNDKWIRYEAVPFGSEVTSYEVSAFYNNDTRQALVVGSVDHDTWKTGVKSSTSGTAINRLEVFGGITSGLTRDELPHGRVAAAAVTSPRIFIGCFADWRDGLETYARANASVAPMRAWTNGVPFGWNSWGSLQGRISYAKGVEVSDFLARELQPNDFENHGVIYVGLDSGWNRFTDEELKRFVEHCRANGQEAGIYWTPFAQWGRDDDATVEGSQYRYKDIFLRANGGKQYLDGGVALDPTHPGTRQRILHTFDRFKAAGYKYVKVDFLTHGALEADHYYDTNITTGMQAYNDGMRFLAAAAGPDIYLNEAISPLFPSQYAQSRRIGCDTFGDIGKIEYTLNSLNYGWWLGGAYRFNDPDHIVLAGQSEGENRARVTSAAITGLFISGDDFSSAGNRTGKRRAIKFLTNRGVNQVAKAGRSFRPVKGNTGHWAGSLFVREDKDCVYLAAFNYSTHETNETVDLHRLGLATDGSFHVRELWSGADAIMHNPMTIRLGPADAALFRLEKR
jgi:alpha-galactosidase